MTLQENTFFSPLKASRNEIIFWVSIVLLCTLKIYEGDQSFFSEYFGKYFEVGPWLDWCKWTYHFLMTFLLFFIVPIIIVLAGRKERLSEYGLKLGDWRFGVKATVISFIVVILPAYLSSKNPDHLQWYPLTTLSTQSSSLFVLWGLCYLPHYIGWEFFFRGYIGFGARKHYGAFAGIMLQTLLTTLMHIGKPEGETWGTVAAGIYLGMLTYRTGSVLWPILFHFYIGMLNTYFCGIWLY